MRSWANCALRYSPLAFRFWRGAAVGASSLRFSWSRALACLVRASEQCVAEIKAKGERRRARADSAVVAQQLAEPGVDFHGVFRGLVDHLDPAARFLGRASLRDQVSCLYDRFEGVAEIVRQKAEFFGQRSGNFVFGDGHTGSFWMFG
jgi:hypothetical protein